MTQPSLFPPPAEVPWDMFVRALAEAHDKGRCEKRKKPKKKGAGKNGTKAL